MARSTAEWSPSALAYVSALQKAALDRLGIADHSFSQVDPEKTQAFMATPFETPGFYHLLSGYADDLRRAADSIGRPLAFQPHLATMASGSVNAVTILLPGAAGEYVVLFEFGLFGFLNLITKVIATSILLETNFLVETSTSPIDKSQMANDLEARFIDAYRAYVAHGHPMFAQPYPANPQTRPLHGLLLESTELFVLGHEFGHVIEGHFDEQKVVPVIKDGVEIREVPRSWIEELHADARGLELLIAAAKCRGIPSQIAYAGAEMFFSAVEFVDYVISVLNHGRSWLRAIEANYATMTSALDESAESSALGSHPPAAVRREELRRLLVENASREVSDQLIAYADRVRAVHERLWSNTLDQWYALHEAGARPSVLWNTSSAV